MFINCILRHRVFFMGFTGHVGLWPGLVIFRVGYQLSSRRLFIRKWGWRGICFSQYLFQLAKRCGVQVFSLPIAICKLFKSGRRAGQIEGPCFWSLIDLLVFLSIPLPSISTSFTVCKTIGSLCNECVSPLPLLLKTTKVRNFLDSSKLSLNSELSLWSEYVLSSVTRQRKLRTHLFHNQQPAVKSLCLKELSILNIKWILNIANWGLIIWWALLVTHLWQPFTPTSFHHTFQNFLNRRKIVWWPPLLTNRRLLLRIVTPTLPLN